MDDFRDNLLPGSFRGVPFEVPGGETVVGRLTVHHQYPKRDKGLVEDLGRADSQFIVEGFIIGDDYLKGRNRLILALMEEGPGTLVHPTFGELQVTLVDQARLREQFIERRGMVTFTLRFIEAGPDQQPGAQIDTQMQVDAAADDAYDACHDDFASEFDIDSAPGWSVESITDEIRNAADTISAVRQRLTLNLTALSQLVQAGNQFKASLVGLLAVPNALATQLSALVRGLVGLFDFSAAQQQVFGESTSVRKPISELLSLSGYGATRPTVPTNTPSRRQQAANQAAVATLVARASVIEAVRASTFVPFSSRDEAIALRNDLYDALEELILDAPDPVYRVLLNLRAAMVQDITDRGADLSALSAITLADSTPAVVLSFRLYDSIDYAQEIVDRNQPAATVMHPLFVPGGAPLEVRRV